MNIEEIKKRRQDYLDSIKNYVEDKHEEKKEKFLYWAEQDIQYLLSIIELQSKALNDAKDALDNQYRFNGGIIENNKAYMAIFNALTILK